MKILVFFLGKTSTIHELNFCSGMPLRKVHELTFLWFGLPGPLLIIFGVLNFYAFSLLVLCLFKVQVEAEERKN